MIKVKPGVRFSHKTFMYPEMWRIVFQAQLLAPNGYEVTITSGCEGNHSDRSKHLTGKAIDFRIRDFPIENRITSWVTRIQNRLGDEYAVLLEADHIHIQWNG